MAATWNAELLKEYVEAIFSEHRRATEQAERERELAAAALREGLMQSISDGDERLREHVHNQVNQINTALNSAESLEQQRIENASLQVSALRKEMLLLHEASEKAIAKAESATERRFDSVNEFRQQLGDQVTQFFPREVAESQFAQMNTRIAHLEGLHREGAGRESGIAQNRRATDVLQGKVTAAVGVVLAALAIAVTIILAVN